MDHQEFRMSATIYQSVKKLFRLRRFQYECQRFEDSIPCDKRICISE